MFHRLERRLAPAQWPGIRHTDAQTRKVDEGPCRSLSNFAAPSSTKCAFRCRWVRRVQLAEKLKFAVAWSVPCVRSLGRAHTKVKSFSDAKPERITPSHTSQSGSTTPRFQARSNHHETAVTMGHSAGLRAGTRYAFSRGFKKTGYIPLSTYLRNYKCVTKTDME